LQKNGKYNEGLKSISPVFGELEPVKAGER